MHIKGVPSGLYYKVPGRAPGVDVEGAPAQNEEGLEGIPENICRDMRIMGGEGEGISIHHFISEIMKKVTEQYKEDLGLDNVTLYIHLLCCLAPID